MSTTQDALSAQAGGSPEPAELAPEPGSLRAVLAQLEASATSSADKGGKFERLVAAYLRTDPVFVEQFDEVWLWPEWPGRDGKHDTGIDIVARRRLTGELTAVQAKFFAPTTTITKPHVDTLLSASGKAGFTERLIVSTSDRWNGNAEDALRDQQVPVRRIGVHELEASAVDWSQFSLADPTSMTLQTKKTLRPHQRSAIANVLAGFADHDRGKMIMACGRGKTFTSLRLAEECVGGGGRVLFLVPSISLMSQTLREWSAEAEVELTALAVCSDRKVTKSAAASPNGGTGVEDISPVDLALPSTTDPAVLADRLRDAAEDPGRMTVVFATYQSIDVVARAQRDAGLPAFDLIICDEAHRTTGATLAGENESAFVSVHDNNYLGGAKRLYMTATPRIYDDSSKSKAGDANAVLASMDDEEIYGPEMHRLAFGEAVGMGLLTDYKVLVLAVDEQSVAKTFQQQLSDAHHELSLSDAARIVGCWNGLAKRGESEHSFAEDPAPMRRAVAFAGSIADSKAIQRLFSSVVEQYIDVHDLDATGDDSEAVLRTQVRHVDGTYNALERNRELDWLKERTPDGTCRVLTNARCLSEGVDVPALDAVLFLSPRKSVVDVVQSVGRVMRLSEDKQYGYIILPVGIPAGSTPEAGLAGNPRYAVVWEVLQALRAHDERFDAMVNKIELNKSRDAKVNIIGVRDLTSGGDETGTGTGTGQDVSGSSGSGGQLALGLAWPALDDWRDAIYARVVTKVGNRRYWETWAKDIAAIADRHMTRISALLAEPSTGVQDQFNAFLEGLRGNLNDNITREAAIEMLSQHLISRPVFEALFEDYDFAEHNPVARTMQRMLDTLDEHSIDDENASLEKFYDSVRVRARGIDNAEGRQRIIVELYEKFFAHAFPRTVDKLGIVYTPVEIVDFILRSADWALREEFGYGLTDEGVHIIDGFTGTGTFMTRLLQSGLIEPHDLARKYTSELHANEILLLAYYIAAVNIEAAYIDLAREHGLGTAYVPFEGLVLADTFQMYEADDEDDLGVFPENNERLNRQRNLDIRVAISNPPYSSGQDSANDNNANDKYEYLDLDIRETYAARSSATNKNSLYDSYIRAIKWASRRVKDRGVIAFVTNGGFLDGNTADGMRQVLAEEFSSIYVLNLRGNQRTAGEQSRREGGKVFGAGSRATVAVTMFVKNPDSPGLARIRYHDIGDYLSREDKLRKVSEAGSIAGLDLAVITPNASGDWLNQRTQNFDALLPVGDKERPDDGIFTLFSRGLASGRDAWVYNFDRQAVEEHMRSLVDVYNKDRIAWSMRAADAERPFDDVATADPRKISWTRGLKSDARRGTVRLLRGERITVGLYRPFCRQYVYFDRPLNDMVYRLERIFPTPKHDNFGFYYVGAGSAVPFSVLMTDQLPDLHVTGAGSGGQYFPRWRYESVEEGGLFGIDGPEVRDGYRRIDNITDAALKRFQEVYGGGFTKDDVFFYVYGLLHSPDYRQRYSADLKRSLPRVPLVTDPQPYVAAGRTLSALHLGYEDVEPAPLGGLETGPDDAGTAAFDYFRIEKMRFGKPSPEQKAAGVRADRSTVVLSPRVALTGIPEGAYRYTLGSRSAIEWVMERYQVKTDAGSGIVNDPNAWARSHDDPRYIPNLLARVVTVALETVRAVDELPALEVLEPTGDVEASAP